MGGRRGPNGIFSYKESPITVIGSAITISGIDMNKPHCFAGVQFFSDSGGTTPATPTAGTMEIEIKTINTNLFEPAPGGTILGSEPLTVSWAANTKEVRATPANVDVATHYKLVVTCNET